MKTSTAKIIAGASIVFLVMIATAKPHKPGNHPMPPVGQVQVSPDSQYESPKKPKKAIFVGELNAGGDAKEVVVNRVISQCYLEIVSGTVSINTVVVRPEKLSLPQTVRLTPGQLHTIDLGGKRSVTGFRISDNGRGVYRVFVK